MRKVYLFNNTAEADSDWNHCMLMADDGVVLGSHICSHRGFMYGDLVERPDRKETLKEYFGGKAGEAYEVIVVPQGEAPPKDVTEKNTKAGEVNKAKKLSEAAHDPKVGDELLGGE